MNGAQPPKDATGVQEELPGGSANGAASTINKKRKKDALKPIITTEAPITS